LNPLKKISACITAVGICCIWTIKFLIRPFVPVAPELKILVGVAPNLIGSFLLPFGACWFFQRIFRLQTQWDLTLTCSVGLLLVIINEYLQLIPLFGRTFDYLDILSSVLGVFLGHISFGRLMLSPRFATK
jgi:hypothetical protein